MRGRVFNEWAWCMQMSPALRQGRGRGLKDGQRVEGWAWLSKAGGRARLGEGAWLRGSGRGLKRAVRPIGEWAVDGRGLAEWAWLR